MATVHRNGRLKAKNTSKRKRRLQEVGEKLSDLPGVLRGPDPLDLPPPPNPKPPRRDPVPSLGEDEETPADG